MNCYLTATGAAFNLSELFYNFDYKKLKVTSTECLDIINNKHRNFLVTRVFKDCVNLVMLDIVDNNVTFYLPLTGNKKCNIHMQRIRGNSFKNLRRNGKWRDVDLLDSNFTGYLIGVYLLGNRTPRIKNVYVHSSLKNLITKNTNLGKSYGDGKVDTTTKDYFEKIQELYPLLNISDIKRIVNFGWRSLYLLLSYGADVNISDSKCWYYFGFLKNNRLKYFEYYARKLALKLRIIYRRKGIKWDGYYYFALTDKQYENYIKQKNKRGRPKKSFTFENIVLYLILDECKIQEHSKKYIFKVPYSVFINFKFYPKKIILNNPELIITREPLKFLDILVHYNKYEIL